ncbi:MAG: glycosyltransferase family 4 protein [Chloroflexi bacterium]|nr:glycosyltransferase family 4 protein [Chloroflexota bacterium]
MRTAFVSTYPPRRCGVATFSQALGAATGERVVVALQPTDQELPYPFEVAHRIRRDELGDYLKVAEILNLKVDAVSVQHDFSTWGGPDGSHVLDFVGALDVPSITTLHELPARPTASQRSVLARLIDASATTVVMCRAAQATLIDEFGLPPSRVEVVPHGVPELPLVDSSTVKPSLGLAGRLVILSAGLLGPDRGYEEAIDAMPAVVAAQPTATYVILGATQPELVTRAGEAYRQSLVARADALGLGDAVRFVERYRGRVELTRWLQATDIVLTPYRDLDRVVSGTLSYAMGAGRAIVSTPFAYAADLLADGRGILVPPRPPSALTRALIGLLADDSKRAELGGAAYDRARSMTWPAIGAEYRRVFELAAKKAAVSAA